MKKINTIIFILFTAYIAVSAQEKIKLTILHTNDTHSQVEPLEANASKNPNMGGYARRMGVIEKMLLKWKIKKGKTLLSYQIYFCR